MTHRWLNSRPIRGTADSQLADGLHEVVYFSVHGRLADSQVLLHTDAGKEGQDHLCEYRWFHFGFLGFDISRDQIFEKSVALRNDFLRRAWEHRELAHGIDREAAFLTLQAAGREFQKALDVLPAERVGGQQLFLLLFSQVVSQTLANSCARQLRSFCFPGSSRTSASSAQTRSSVKRGTTTARSSPFFPLRRSGHGRTPTTNGPRKPSAIASALYGICSKCQMLARLYLHARLPL
jgi:hypothetical protein